MLKNKPIIRSARNRMMDMIARRDHSVHEIRTKLKRAQFSEDEINKAIQYGLDHNWIADETLQSERTAGYLHRRNKGIQYINKQLSLKRLPKVSADPELELEKALALVNNKFDKKTDLSREDFLKYQAKIARFLAARGFNQETVSRSLKEFFKK